MNANGIDLKRGVSIGALSGMIWGVIVLTISSMAKVFEFDYGPLHNIPVFLAGGAGFGLVLGAFMEVLKEKLPFKGIVRNTIALSVGIWLVFFAGGMLLHFALPGRYHLEVPQHIQGFLLSFILGIVLGILWKKSSQD